MNEQPRVAVITGGHHFDVLNFHQLFRSYSEFDVYIQSMYDFSGCSQEMRDSYDVVVFYHMLGQEPVDGENPWDNKPRSSMERLMETEQGVVVLHHAILAYEKYPLWNELVGIEDRSFDFYLEQTVSLEVADGDHPIARGLSPWILKDETYTMAEPGADSHVILTTNHSPSMNALLWTREVRKKRVVCYQSGHDDLCWSDHVFREVLRRSIAWCGRTL